MPKGILRKTKSVEGIYTMLNEVQPDAVNQVILFYTTNRIALNVIFDIIIF